MITIVTNTFLFTIFLNPPFYDLKIFKVHLYVILTTKQLIVNIKLKNYQAWKNL